MADEPTDFEALIPELKDWISGGGCSAREWVECVGNYPLAIGYSFIFWPSFVRFERYVLREGFSEGALRGFESNPGVGRTAVEWVMNHVHMADIHYNAKPQPNEAQLRYLGRILKEIHEVKLRADFPDLRFEVEFYDKPGIDLIDLQVSFWQVET